MARGDFSQQFVGSQQHLFHINDLLGRQGAVEVLRDDVRIDTDVRAADTGSLQPALADDQLDQADQLPRNGTLLDFLANQFRLCRFQNVVQVGQQGSQCQSHRCFLPDEIRPFRLPHQVPMDSLP
jgi:hypothetical protein